MKCTATQAIASFWFNGNNVFTVVEGSACCFKTNINNIFKKIVLSWLMWWTFYGNLVEVSWIIEIVSSLVILQSTAAHEKRVESKVI